jgi:hypothetical protein
VIAYLTDVEGMWGRFASFATGNPALRLAGDALELSPGATFVFGGDAIDRGPHGRLIVRTLLDARARHGERVILLAGNRDINKLRLVRELAGHPPARLPLELRGAPRPQLLRWIFANTMGARDAFEHRRSELAVEERDTGDEAVVESFLEDLAPGGDLRRYLEEARLAHRAGDVLFVHGGITTENLFAVPGAPAPASGVDAWVDALNAWYRAQLEAFAAGELGDDGTPAWQPLIAYQAPTPGRKVNMESVVYGRTADDLNNPYLPERAVVTRLRAEGVTRVVVGHTPNGDTPSILRDGDFQLVIADTSHARVPGNAKVLLEPGATSVEGATVLDDQRRAGVTFRIEPGDDTPIGLRAGDTGHLVKGRLDDGDYLMFRYLAGFKTEQVAVSPSALAGRPLAPPY